MTDLALRVLGCRGSMSVAGDRYRRYGGNTTSFHVEAEPGHHLIVDCGSGLRNLHEVVVGRSAQRYSVFFTHYHWDHIQGLPVFRPLFESGTAITFHGPESEGLDVEAALKGAIRPPWWPIAPGDFAASVSYRSLDGPVRVGGLSVKHAHGTHPQGVTAYEIAGPKHRVVIATDHENGVEAADRAITAMASGADVLIHDAQYTPEELAESRRGWGHSSYEGAAAMARQAGVHRLVITSHDPDRSDEQIDRLRGAARALFPNTDAAYEGMEIPL